MRTAMLIADILTPERVLCGVQAGIKRRVLEQLSRLFAKYDPELDSNAIYQQLFERERLGSTGIGKGVAIPHARMSNLEHTMAAFIQLETPVDFNAIDNRPVDLVFALLVPESATHEQETHLQTLAHLAAMFNDDAWREQLRDTESLAKKYQLMLNWRNNSAEPEDTHK